MIESLTKYLCVIAWVNSKGIKNMKTVDAEVGRCISAQQVGVANVGMHLQKLKANDRDIYHPGACTDTG